MAALDKTMDSLPTIHNNPETDVQDLRDTIDSLRSGTPNVRRSVIQREQATPVSLPTTVAPNVSDEPKVSELKLMYSKCKSDAKRRKIEFDLSFDYYAALAFNTKHCPFTGYHLIYKRYTGQIKPDDSKASLDRIDNSKGYIEGNVRFVSWVFNRVKGTLSDEQLEDLVNRLFHRNNF